MADDPIKSSKRVLDQLFRQGRWEAQLFKSELMAEQPVTQALPLAEQAVRSAEQAVATVDHLAPAIERAVGVAETAPKLITAEREVAIKAVQDELTRTIKFMQEERVAALDRLTSERLAAIKDLQVTFVAERKALTQDLEQISPKVVVRAFWRTAQLIVVTLVVVFIGIVLLLFPVRRLFAARSPKT